MTETERYVNQSCERIVVSGHVRLYRDLYRDLRERLPCGVACRLIRKGLEETRRWGSGPGWPDIAPSWAARARAIAALTRLWRYADCIASYEDVTGKTYDPEVV